MNPADERCKQGWVSDIRPGLSWAVDRAARRCIAMVIAGATCGHMRILLTYPPRRLQPNKLTRRQCMCTIVKTSGHAAFALNTTQAC